jgi:tripartite-type tricarboxylate transporter receptor subunit TctC
VSSPKFASSYKSAIGLIKKNPNKFNYGSVGKGSSVHLLMLLLMKEMNLAMVHIPYKSAGLQVALMSGEIDLCFTTLEFAKAHQASGKMKILAYTSERRLESYPDIPTLAEYIPNFSIDFNLGMMASENTPASQIQEMNNTINQILVNPEFKKSFNLPGLNLAKPHPPSYYGEILNKELQFWSGLITRIGKENIT